MFEDALEAFETAVEIYKSQVNTIYRDYVQQVVWKGKEKGGLGGDSVGGYLDTPRKKHLEYDDLQYIKIEVTYHHSRQPFSTKKTISKLRGLSVEITDEHGTNQTNNVGLYHPMDHGELIGELNVLSCS